MNFVIRANRITQLRKILTFKAEAGTHTIDYSPWADDNGTVTASVINVKSGQASVSNESLASNVKTFVLTTSETGASMLTFTATAGNNTKIVYLYILTKDPTAIIDDYGLVI